MKTLTDLEVENADLRQYIFKIENSKKSEADRDIDFLKEMKVHAEKAYSKRDIASQEMLLQMIDDWISELENPTKQWTLKHTQY